MSKLVRRFRRSFRCGEKGFTLIELLVVVAILGILAAVVVPNVGSFIGEGKDEAAATELHDVQLAMTATQARAQTSDVTAVLLAAATNNLAALPTDSSGGAFAEDFDDFLVSTDCEFYYYWDADGTCYQYYDAVVSGDPYVPGD